MKQAEAVAGGWKCGGELRLLEIAAALTRFGVRRCECMLRGWLSLPELASFTAASFACMYRNA
jgi:hypothetical protein